MVLRALYLLYDQCDKRWGVRFVHWLVLLYLTPHLPEFQKMSRLFYYSVGIIVCDFYRLGQSDITFEWNF